MARTSRTGQAILGFLTWRPMTGYDIRKAMAASTGNFWSESFGQIYPALRRLVAAGDVEPRSGARRQRPRGPGLPADAARKGHAARLARAACRRRREPPRNELLLKLFFGRHNDPAVNARHVARHREQALARLESYAAIERDLRRRHDGHPDLPYWLMTVSYGRRVERALIGWCDDTLAALDGRETTSPTAPAPSAPAQEEPADERHRT